VTGGSLREERSDEELLAALAARDASALEDLYARYGRLAFSLAVRITAVPETAEEVVQEVFLAAWRSAATYQASRASARTWLLSITHHRAVDAVRRRAARVQQAPLELQIRDPEVADVWTEVSRTLDAEQVRKALRELPAEQRESIDLAYFHGLTYPEIAERMNVPLGTVKSRLRLGLAKLRSLLREAAPSAGPTL
jgi:RNA polymerase sigma factor (sigma-70 family)